MDTWLRQRVSCFFFLCCRGKNPIKLCQCETQQHSCSSEQLLFVNCGDEKIVSKRVTRKWVYLNILFMPLIFAYQESAVRSMTLSVLKIILMNKTFCPMIDINFHDHVLNTYLKIIAYSLKICRFGCIGWGQMSLQSKILVIMSEISGKEEKALLTNVIAKLLQNKNVAWVGLSSFCQAVQRTLWKLM